MSQLPSRPDLDQLRRQARELHRAAVAGDAGSLQRLHLVSGRVTLSAAQLAVAREYGFASWSRLKDEAERRRGASHEPAPPTASPAAPPPGTVPPAAAAASAAPPPPAPAAAPPKAGAQQAGPPSPKSWQDMRKWAADLLLARTGADVAAWNQRVAEAGPGTEQALRAWLAGQGVTGYSQALLVWERFGYPEFLVTDADDLIEGQYADRPKLRPILGAVLAALPELGPVTVQARKTFVSLVTPRRTFAVVQATTKNRVDLGLRLDGTRPGGRLLPARDIGAATLRIALATPEDVDDEVLGWLRRAYDENAAPPAPRRPARRPATALGPLTVVIEGFDLPGRTCRPEPDGTAHQNVHVALSGRSDDRPTLTVPGRPGRAIEPVPGDAATARWQFEVTVRRDDAGFDFTGPFTGGDRADRSMGLAWGDVPGDGTLRIFRGTKLCVRDIDPGVIEQAIQPGHRLTARIRLTDPRGNPVCARVRPPVVTWSAEPAT
jgi:hypothetical protein